MFQEFDDNFMYGGGGDRDNGRQPLNMRGQQRGEARGRGNNTGNRVNENHRNRNVRGNNQRGRNRAGRNRGFGRGGERNQQNNDADVAGRGRGNAGAYRGRRQYNHHGNRAQNIQAAPGEDFNNTPREERPAWRGIGYKKLERWSLETDPEELIVDAIKSKAELVKLLSEEDIKDDWIILLIKVFSIICQGRRSENKNAVINMLSGSIFLKSVINNKLIIWGTSPVYGEKNFQEFGNNLITVFTTFQQLFPARYIELPLEILKIFLRSKPIIYDEAKVDLMFEERKRYIDKTVNPKKEGTSTAANETYEQPPECYRELTTIPNRNDILEDRPFLRRIKDQGAYEDGEEYLDVQFRLLREDLIRPLRTGMLEIMNEVPKDEREVRIKIYQGVRFMYAECTNNGLIQKISFQTEANREVSWKHSRRLLFGSLLCFSKDNFNSFIFATVANRDVKELEKGILSIRLDNNNDIKYFHDTNTLVMIESASYFEAYKHVLEALKDLTGDEVPMQKYVVKSEIEVESPSYLSIDNEYNLKGSLEIPDQIKSTVRVLEDQSWPDSENTDLNSSQLAAFKHALTKEFVLIQGPPGTGKTHVGLRIVHALLENKIENEPILIVCYTNHALDQFLQGLLRFGHRNLIRVGGRCAEELMEYNLKNKSIRLMTQNKKLKRQEQDDDFKEIKRIRQAKHVPFEERQVLINELSEKLRKSQTAETTLKEGIFLPYFELQNVIAENLKYFLEPYEYRCQEFGLSVFDIFLNVINLPPDALFEIDKAEIDIANINEEGEDENENDIDKNIDVEGEGNRLFDLYVLNEKLYEVKRKENKRKGKKHIKKLVDKDGFEYVMPTKKAQGHIIRKEFDKCDMMSLEEVNAVVNPWMLNKSSRWGLYKYWIFLHKQLGNENIGEDYEKYEQSCLQVKEFEDMEDAVILRNADVIAMTTTGAARYRNVLRQIEPSIVVVEEAAEVLEAHVLTSLNTNVKHLILIGDHQQLRPNPSDYELAKNYGLNVSLFQRMINNKLECHTLNIQHRMRPEISIFLRHIYSRLRNHPSVETYPNIKGVEKNVFFLNLESEEHEIKEMKSKMNMEEAMFIRSFCLYLILNGYETTDITILAGYAGQVIQFKRIMEKELFNGVRVTSVDNYQGEENKIILLSLVRSKKIGFWKEDNRICVALSRAKEGLYVVGNFEFFSRESVLWKKIINDAKHLEVYGKEMILCCQNHPEERNLVAKHTDFKNVPLGGCLKPCIYRLRCGHVCENVCHPQDQEHEKYVCRKKCGKKACELNHPCPKRCHFGDLCGECVFRVNKRIPKCGHVQSIPCKTDVEKHICQAKCIKILTCGHQCQQKCGEDCNLKLCNIKVKKLLPCGHEHQVPCYMPAREFKCQSPCEVRLKCNHKCSGNCFLCKEGRLHRRCEEKCERDLPCNHLCKEKCTKNCPPCKMKCENRCGHSKCEQECGKICTPCMEECLWKCKHKACTNLCSERCNRDPCNEPCDKIKDCGHRCIGLCGEPCPTLCRICNKEEVEEIFFGTEDEPDSLFVQLEDCKHILESQGLDFWMSQKDESSEVMLKKCPKCKQVIRKSVRYGNIIKSIMNDVQKIKEKILYGDDFEEVQKEAYEKCRELNFLFLDRQDIGENIEKHHILAASDDLKTFLDTRPKESKKDPIPYGLAARLHNCHRDHAVRIKNQAEFSINVEKVLIDSLNGKKGEKVKDEHQLKDIWKKINDLQIYVFYWNINEEQFENAVSEFNRIKLHIDFSLVYQKLKENEEFRVSSDKRLFEDCMTKLASRKFLDSVWIKNSENVIEKVKKKYQCNGVSREELNMVVNAMGFTKGHWFKCPNGHFYCIGECGGAMETAKCPECKATIGGRNHALASGNLHAAEVDNSRYAAYSEEANNPLNWDPAELDRLQRW